MTMKLFDVTNNTNNVKFTFCVTYTGTHDLELHVGMKIQFKIFKFLVMGNFVKL